MTSFPANFIYGNAIKLHHRVLLIPWMRRNCGVMCTNSRDYSSSAPVKYVPKKSLGNEINEADSSRVKYLRGKEGPSVPMKPKHSELNASIVGFAKSSRGRFLKYEPKNRDQCLSYNAEDGLSLGPEVEEEIPGNFMAEVDELIEDPEDDVEECGKMSWEIDQAGRGRQDAERKAIELLGTRAYTALELKKKLQGKRFPLEIVDAVMMDLQNRGLINDYLYAETFCRSRWSSSSWGPQRIKQALWKKGVSSADTEKAIKLVFEEGEDDEDQDSGITMSKHSMDHLYVQASKQWLRSQGAPLETRKSRIVRWLQYRGFSWSVIKYVLKKLQNGSPS